MVEQRENELIAASSGPWHVFEIAGANHGTFSDFLHLAPETAGSLANDRAHSIISDLLREFFDLYLRGARAPLLDDPASQYQEISEPKKGGTPG